MNEKPVLGIMLGDAAGVGPEIIAKVASDGFLTEQCKPIIIGDLRIFNRALKVIGKDVQLQVIEDANEADWTKGIPFLDRKNLDPECAPFGIQSVESGAACLDMLDTGSLSISRAKSKDSALLH